jgi:DNA-binding CsgD family transcriptional regulator
MSEPLLEEPAIGPQADRNAEIVKRVTSGMSRQVVADELGLTRQRVSQIVIRATGADHQPRHDPWPEERGQRLRAMWDEGLSVNEIARRLGVSRGSVVGKVRRLDLPARPSPIRPNRATMADTPQCTTCGGWFWWRMKAVRVTGASLASVHAQQRTSSPACLRRAPR